MKCELCESDDFAIATVKKTGRRIIICRECDSVYEIDENGDPVLGHDPNDNDYFIELSSLFETWDELEDIVSYKQ